MDVCGECVSAHVLVVPSVPQSPHALNGDVEPLGRVMYLSE
jgi:hypothetical protein